MRIACATASHISLAISRMHYVQSNAQHCPKIENIFLPLCAECPYTCSFEIGMPKTYYREI